MKKCSGCKKLLSFSNFNKHKNRKYGVAEYCKECMKIMRKKRNSLPKNKLKKRIYEREYIHRPHVKKQRQEYAMKYYYGVTIEQKKEMWLKQNKKCLICKKNIEWEDSRLDHDHVSRKVRGILCDDCNLLLGHSFDKIEILKAATQYLKNNLI